HHVLISPLAKASTSHRTAAHSAHKPVIWKRKSVGRLPRRAPAGGGLLSAILNFVHAGFRRDLPQLASVKSPLRETSNMKLGYLLPVLALGGALAATPALARDWGGQSASQQGGGGGHHGGGAGNWGGGAPNWGGHHDNGGSNNWSSNRNANTNTNF